MTRTAAVMIIIGTALLIGSLVWGDLQITKHCQFVGTERAAWAGRYMTDVDVYDCGALGHWHVAKGFGR